MERIIKFLNINNFHLLPINCTVVATGHSGNSSFVNIGSPLKSVKCDVSINFSADNTFVQDAGWDAAAKRYEKFMEDHRGQNVVFLELGVGYNTPGIIKYNFWQNAHNWRNAFYVCINKGDAYVPKEIENKAVGINADLAEVLYLCNS